MSGLRRAVLVVAVLNGAYFFVEFFVAVRIGSVSLLADSVDFLEDTSINVLIFLATVWSWQARRLVGHLLALVILIPGVAAAVMVVIKIVQPEPPSPVRLTVTALGALLVNCLCALILVRYRHHAGSLAKAAWFSARNDALANLAMIAAGLLTAVTLSAWPDVIVGVMIIALNATASAVVWRAASNEVTAAEA